MTAQANRIPMRITEVSDVCSRLHVVEALADFYLTLEQIQSCIAVQIPRTEKSQRTRRECWKALMASPCDSFDLTTSIRNGLQKLDSATMASMRSDHLRSTSDVRYCVEVQVTNQRSQT